MSSVLREDEKKGFPIRGIMLKENDRKIPNITIKGQDVDEQAEKDSPLLGPQLALNPQPTACIILSPEALQ